MKTADIQDTGPERSATTRERSPADQSEAQWVKLESVPPWLKNPRRNQKAVVPVANSIQRFGWGRPILAQLSSRRIIAGHTARLAALELAKRWKAFKSGKGDEKQTEWHPEAIRTAKLGEVLVRFKDLSDAEAEKLAIADNKLGEIAEWDEELLQEQVGAMTFADAMLTGFSGKELAAIAEKALGLDEAAEEAESKLGSGLTYSVIIECDDEFQQSELIQRLESEGLQCKPLIT